MGAWEELDTEFNLNIELSDLDTLNEGTGDLGIFDDITDDLKTKINAGSKRGMSELAKRNVSFQEKWINQNCKNPSGMLASSIDVEEGEYTAITGTRINDIYPMSIEYGRSAIYPVHAKALAFYADNGELIFRKSAGEAKPRPFVAPAYEDTLDIAEEIIGLEIEHELSDWEA